MSDMLFIYDIIVTMDKTSTSDPAREERNGVVDSLLTVPEAAQRLRVKSSWIYGHVHAKSLPFEYHKVGYYIRIRNSTFATGEGSQFTKHAHTLSVTV